MKYLIAITDKSVSNSKIVDKHLSSLKFNPLIDSELQDKYIKHINRGTIDIKI